MGMWVRNEQLTLYKENGRFFSGPDKRFECDERGRTIKKHDAVEVKKPLIEESVTVLGVTKEELDKMSLAQIRGKFNLAPQKGMTKEVLIEEILGVTE